MTSLPLLERVMEAVKRDATLLCAVATSCSPYRDGVCMLPPAFTFCTQKLEGNEGCGIINIENTYIPYAFRKTIATLYSISSSPKARKNITEWATENKLRTIDMYLPGNGTLQEALAALLGLIFFRTLHRYHPPPPSIPENFDNDPGFWNNYIPNNCQIPKTIEDLFCDEDVPMLPQTHTPSQHSFSPFRVIEADIYNSKLFIKCLVEALFTSAQQQQQISLCKCNLNNDTEIEANSDRNNNQKVTPANNHVAHPDPGAHDDNNSDAQQSGSATSAGPVLHVHTSWPVSIRGCIPKFLWGFLLVDARKRIALKYGGRESEPTVKEFIQWWREMMG